NLAGLKISKACHRLNIERITPLRGLLNRVLITMGCAHRCHIPPLRGFVLDRGFIRVKTNDRAAVTHL
ncbi:MAG TPA: hypothetical protein PKA39_02410, partial [Ignavibacteria bacterium]|nr:hypothetical protein [Ignavibacteria bacterium]